MQHNVTITTEENRVIEEYWIISSKKNSIISNRKSMSETEKIAGYKCNSSCEKELDHNPTLQEIAQFLSETKADFVSVEHNYRFADLQGC